MRIVIGAVGRMKDSAQRTLYERYEQRTRQLGRTLALVGPETVEIDEGRARSAAQRREDEAVRLLRHRPPGARLVVLDESGKPLSTREFTDGLMAWRDAGVPACMFALGGADGHGTALRDAADLTLSFGRLTWPHMLARIMLAEQLYRAVTVMAGHPYHRE